MAGTKVAMVTGGNKGIGFAVVRALCKKFPGDVILTSRDEGRGKSAVEELAKEGLKPKYHQLDISDHESIVRLRDFLQKNYGGLDILINNAGIIYQMASTAPFAEQCRVTVKINFFDTLDTCEVLFPILRPHARVVNLSSRSSQSSIAKCFDVVKAKLYNLNITMAELKDIMNDFIQAGQNDEHVEAGYSNFAYGMSKVAVTVMTVIQQREMDKSGADDIVINACCPGIVATEMTNYTADLTIDQGAEHPVFLALLPQNVESPRGKYIRDLQIVPWG